MKTIKYILPILILFFSVQTYAQTKEKTDSIKVSGNCDMCKARIEKALKMDGISKAEWNKKSKILVVTYNPSKTNNDEIQKKVAAVGHDTEKYKANSKVYDKLPGCCKYRE